MSLLKGTCLTNCPAYYYQDAAKSCVRCSGICATCNSEYYCLTCLAGYSNDGYCYSTCPVGTFADANTRKCLPCVSPCLECSNTAKHCTKCINGLVQSQGICSTTCPIGSYNSAGVCLDCTFPCLNCSSSTQCSKCLGGYLLYMGLTCITQTTLCPNDYYKLDNTECVPYT